MLGACHLQVLPGPGGWGVLEGGEVQPYGDSAQEIVDAEFIPLRHDCVPQGGPGCQVSLNEELEGVYVDIPPGPWSRRINHPGLLEDSSRPCTPGIRVEFRIHIPIPSQLFKFNVVCGRY